MTNFDPTDPWGDVSPWDVAGQTQPDQTPESPVTNQPVVANPAPNPFKIGLTLKASSGYDAEWLTPTVYGSSADEVASRTVELVNALKKYGVIELTAKAAEFTRGQFLGGGKAQAAPASKPRFENGRVTNQQAPAGVPDHDDLGVTTCMHGQRKHFAKDNWEAMFCQEREKRNQCPPAFKNKNSGKYEVRS